MMKVKVLIGVLLVCVAALSGGLYWFFVVNMVHGSGVETTETRDLAAFRQIDLSCFGDVDVIIGDQHSVSITSDDNIVPLITTELEGDRLVIDCEKRYRSKLGVKVKVVVAKLDGLVISGSGDIRAGEIKGESFAGSISGSGNMEIERLEGNELSAKVSGSGSLKISGQVEKLNAGISGSGDVNLSDLTSQKVVAKISGSGNIQVRAEESLEARISGSGNITQHGKAKPDAKVSGSGSVRQK